MKFLGDLGIDIRLLIAQMVNFGLLLWLLAKFLYKPIIKRIERDEIELKQTQIQKEELERQTNDFVDKKKKETVEIKRRAREIIKEAEGIAQGIKKEIREKVDKEALATIKQTKDKLESLRPEIEKEVLRGVRTKIGDSFQVSFLSALPLSLQKEFQNIFWVDFIRQVESLTLPVLKDVGLVEILEKFNSVIKKKDEGEDVLKKRLEEILAQKIGPVALEYAHPLTVEQEKKLEKIISEKGGIKLNITKRQNKSLITVEQEKKLEKIISEKGGIKLNITKRQNKSLINGFRLEIAGMIIENNLLNIINDAANFNE